MSAVATRAKDLGDIALEGRDDDDR